MIVPILFLSLIKVNKMIVCVLFLSLVKVNGKDFCCEKTLLFFSQNQLALLESRPSAGFLFGLRWKKCKISYSMVSDAIFFEISLGTLLGAKCPEKGRLKINGD